ncbi:hypothetical protein BFL43_23855 [Williamsia sp. 1135]|nr:hypothetical protein BFL43_23855 [Williamsia sp. 1135]
MDSGRTPLLARLSLSLLTYGELRTLVDLPKTTSAVSTSVMLAISAMHRRLVLALVSLSTLLISACVVDESNPVAVPAASDSTSLPSLPKLATPVPLPFDNPFPDRWNSSNDGTAFEPCVAYSHDELDRFGIDSAEIEDAAIVNGQGVRGCSWSMENWFSLSNLVTNSSSLEVYKRGMVEYTWHPDLHVEGRVVGLFSISHGGSTDCSTYVQSYSAAVVTNVVPSTSAQGKSVDTCKLAIDFTRAYIDKIPE